MLALVQHDASGQGAKPEARPMQYDRLALDNPYVTVMRDEARCATAEPAKCEDRVILAMGDVEITADNRKRNLKRGQIALFKSGQSYSLPAGSPFYEIAIKPGHPPVKSPPEIIAAPKNLFIHQHPKFFIYEEKLVLRT